jgi:hypothetical protein
MVKYRFRVLHVDKWCHLADKLVQRRNTGTLCGVAYADLRQEGLSDDFAQIGQRGDF